MYHLHLVCIRLRGYRSTLADTSTALGDRRRGTAHSLRTRLPACTGSRSARPRRSSCPVRSPGRGRIRRASTRATVRLACRQDTRTRRGGRWHDTERWCRTGDATSLWWRPQRTGRDTGRARTRARWGSHCAPGSPAYTRLRSRCGQVSKIQVQHNARDSVLESTFRRTRSPPLRCTSERSSPPRHTPRSRARQVDSARRVACTPPRRYPGIRRGNCTARRGSPRGTPRTHHTLPHLHRDFCIVY